MRILETATKQIDNSLTVRVHDGLHYRIVFRGETEICDDGPDTLARVAGYALDSGNLTGKAIAWIGVGLCVGPKLFAISDCSQSVYEIEPALSEFCPPGIAFIPGDWRITMTGKFDVIVYDIAGEVPRKELGKFLNPGGAILPKETL